MGGFHPVIHKRLIFVQLVDISRIFYGKPFFRLFQKKKGAELAPILKIFLKIPTCSKRGVIYLTDTQAERC